MAVRYGIAPGLSGPRWARPPSGASYGVNWANPITRNLVFFASWLNTGTDLAIDLVRGRRSTRTGTQERKAVSDPEMGEVFEWGQDGETGVGEILNWGNLNYWNGKSQGSIAVWFKALLDAPLSCVLFGCQNASVGWEGYNVETWKSSGYPMRNTEASSDNTYEGYECPNTGLSGQWESLVTIYNGNWTEGDRLHLYLNGKRITGGTMGNVPTAMGTFTDNWQIHIGNIDSEDAHFRAMYLGAWTRTLTPNEITQLYAPQTRFDIYKFNDPKFYLIPQPLGHKTIGRPGT